MRNMKLPLALLAILAAFPPEAKAQDESDSLILRGSYAKGQKFAVTSEIEFVGDPLASGFFGNPKLKASFDCVVEGAESGKLTCTSSFRALSGKGNVKVDGKRWSYDLLWKTGSDFRKTVISHLPIEEAEKAAGDLGDAFKGGWTARQKPFEASLEGKTESLSFLQAWMPSLFILPGPLPFSERKVRKGDRFEEGGWTWGVEEFQSTKHGSKVAFLAGKTSDEAQPKKILRLGVDSRGFVTFLKLEHFEKGEEKPSFRFEGSADRP
jgi:hypothetical protein